jgi:hypothetical protein
MRIPYAILIILLVCSCQDRKKTDLSTREIPFISFNEFYNTAFESDEPKIPTCVPFSYNNLTSLSQIDSLRNHLCSNNLIIDCSGCISLIYPFKTDTIFIPAFNVNCNCNVKLVPVKRIALLLKDDLIYFKNLSTTKITNLEEIRDSLASDFSKSISDFCILMNKRRPYFNNPDSMQAYRYPNSSFRRVLSIGLSDDTQILHLNKLIDIAYETYLLQLRTIIPNIYKTTLDNLDAFEYNTFVKNLFFPVNIIKDISPEYIPPVKNI